MALFKVVTEAFSASRELDRASLTRLDFWTRLSAILRSPPSHRLRLVPRAFVPHTRGIERAPEPPDPERYFRTEEMSRLIAVARVMDHRWCKLVALIIVSYHTGLRVGSFLRLRGKDLDLAAGTIVVNRTKTGDPITLVLCACAYRRYRFQWVNDIQHL